MKENLIPTIGLEIHTELNTNSKMFCGCINKHFNIKPNSHTCPVCLGLPGALPVENKKAVEWTLLLGLSLKCRVNKVSKFDRKHYFYPDLPKGYQISQYDEPFCVNGKVETSEGEIRIERVHLEEDTGKLIHKKINGKNVTLVDFNRSGVPLVEIVTKPDIYSAKQAKEFAQELQQIIRYLGISDCDMEKGSMRLEANISQGKHFGYKVEIKNLNSFKFVEQAINYELERQERLIKKGKIPMQETRGWDENKKETTAQRFKEEASDYRYFPEPDIPPMIFKDSYIKKLRESIPELPDDIAKRFVEKYEIRKDYAQLLTLEKNTAWLVEKAFLKAQSKNFDLNELASVIVNKKINLKVANIDSLIDEIIAKKEEIITDESKLMEWSKKAIKQLPEAKADYKKGKGQALYAFVGKVIQLSKGKADPKKVVKTLKKLLD